MTRDTAISKMIRQANLLKKNGWTRDGENAIWDIASEYNRTHDDEIFMCEYQSDNSEYVNGFMIEDDYWTFEQ